MTAYCRNSLLADKVRRADGFFQRFKGLMGRKSLEDGEGLLLKTAAIHCFFMRMPIDAVYLSENMTVLGKETLRPWKIGALFRGTRYVLELAAGKAKWVASGDQLTFEQESKEGREG